MRVVQIDIVLLSQNGRSFLRGVETNVVNIGDPARLSQNGRSFLRGVETNCRYYYRQNISLSERP